MSQEKSEGARVAVGILRIFMGFIMNALFYAVAFVIILYLAKNAYFFVYQVFGSEVVDNAPGKSITITISEDDTMSDVAKTLEQQKIIVDWRSFEVRAILTEKEIRPGVYTVNSSQSYAEILNILNTE